MYKKTISLPLCLMLASCSLIFAGCGSADTSKNSPTEDTSFNKPAPDNNSDNNPSLADTSYINKDSSKRVQNGDTTH